MDDVVASFLAGLMSDHPVPPVADIEAIVAASGCERAAVVREFWKQVDRFVNDDERYTARLLPVRAALDEHFHLGNARLN